MVRTNLWNSITTFARGRQKFVINAIVYMGTGLLQKGGRFLLIPLLVTTLSPSDFTRYGLLISTVTFLPVLLSLNMHSAPTRLLFEYPNQEDRVSLLKTTLLSCLWLTSIGVTAIIIGLRLFKIGDPISLGILSLQLAVAAVVLSAVVVQFTLAVARIYGAARHFAITAGMASVGVILLYALLLPLFPPSFELVLGAYAISFLLVSIYSLWPIRSYWLAGRFRWDLAKAAFQFSSPTVISALGLWLIGSSGAWIGSQYMPLADLADYTLLVSVIGGAGMFGRSLFDARIPAIGVTFASGRYRDGLKLMSRTSFIAAGLVTVLYAGIFLLVYVLKLPIPPHYVPSLKLLIIAFVISIIDCGYLFGFQMLLALRRTNIQAGAMIIAGVVVIIMSLLLIKGLHSFGLILSTALGYVIQSGIMCYFAIREYQRHIDNDAIPSIGPGNQN